MHRAKVGRLTRQAQIASALLVGGAVVLAVVPTASDEPVAVAPIPKAPPKDTTPKRPPPDPFELAAAMENASPLDAPSPAPPVVPGESTVAAAEPAPPPPPPAQWRYVGSVIGPTLRRAVLAKEDQQKIVSEGESIDDWTIKTITPKSLTIVDKGVEREEPLSARAARPDDATLGETSRPMGVPNPTFDPSNPMGMNPGASPGPNPSPPLRPVRPNISTQPNTGRPGVGGGGGAGPNPNKPSSPVIKPTPIGAAGQPGATSATISQLEKRRSRPAAVPTNTPRDTPAPTPVATPLPDPAHPEPPEPPEPPEQTDEGAGGRP